MATHVSLLAICECLLLFTANAAPPSEEHLAMASSEYREDLATDTAEETVGETDSVNEELINSLSPDAPSYFEGDIVLTAAQRAVIEWQNGGSPSLHQSQRAINRRESSLWKDGKVPYYISSSLGNKARSAIQSAIREYSSSTCIQLYPRDSESDYIYFFKGSGCYSSVGVVGGGQTISIGSGCEYKGIVIHEIFHALGRWHEQSRPDRDQFIRINYDNIRDGVESNFFKLSDRQVTTQGVEYDFGSIMHYSAYAFSRNGRPTIELKSSSSDSSSVMGQRSGLSARDLEHIQALYCNVDSTSASWSDWSEWTACSESCNGGIRTRTRTCQGGSTCTGSGYQQEPCNSQPCEVPAEWGPWSSWSGCSASCGGGRQSRTRQCVGGNACSGTSAQYRDCNEDACPGPIESGLKYEGCYRVLAGYGLYLLEDSVDSLTDNPFQREEPVEKCAQAASFFSYSVIGVAAGYCISGNNRLSDYTVEASDECLNSRGAYSKGRFFMDVYSITEPAYDGRPDVQNDSAESADQSSSSNVNTSIITLIITILCMLLL